MNIHVRVKLIKNPKGQFIQGLHNETLQTDILAKAEYLKCLRILLNMLKHLNQHFGTKPTYINKLILLLKSLHIKSQGQMLSNNFQFVLPQTTLNLLKL